MFALALSVGAALACGCLPSRAENIQSCEGSKVNLPDSFKMICSATWRFEGKCTGEEMVERWKVGGRTAPPDAFIRPWADTPILVVGYELMKLPSDDRYEKAKQLNDKMSWFMIGSGIAPQPDTMLWLWPGQTGAKNIWPAESGQIWPAKKDAITTTRYTDVLDLHGQCFGGGEITMFLTIYYISSPAPRQLLP
jgi:hypothetical protein